MRWTKPSPLTTAAVHCKSRWRDSPTPAICRRRSCCSQASATAPTSSRQSTSLSKDSATAYASTSTVWLISCISSNLRPQSKPKFPMKTASASRTPFSPTTTVRSRSLSRTALPQICARPALTTTPLTAAPSRNSPSRAAKATAPKASSIRSTCSPCVWPPWHRSSC